MLKNKVSIITGAGSGIGQAIAVKFATVGSYVVLAGRTKTKLEDTLNIIHNKGGTGLVIPTDISDIQSIENLVKNTIHEYSKIDVLVNCAGVTNPIGPVEKISIREWENNIRTNLFGTLYLIKNVIPFMIINRGGKIINLSGGGAFNPRPNFSAYAVSKSAIVRLSETLSLELEKYNIYVNSISPGAIKTEMTYEIFNNDDSGFKEKQDAKRVIDSGGADITKVENLSLFLASEESNGLSGKTLSAQWDDLNYIKNNIKSVQSSDKYTMKRVV